MAKTKFQLGNTGKNCLTYTDNTDEPQQNSCLFKAILNLKPLNKISSFLCAVSNIEKHDQRYTEIGITAFCFIKQHLHANLSLRLSLIWLSDQSIHISKTDWTSVYMWDVAAEFFSTIVLVFLPLPFTS